jgi:hypothetical protein
LRGARGSPFRSLTGIHHKRSLFEIEALHSREMFTQFLNAFALANELSGVMAFCVKSVGCGMPHPEKVDSRYPLSVCFFFEFAD